MFIEEIKRFCDVYRGDTKKNYVYRGDKKETLT